MQCLTERRLYPFGLKKAVMPGPPGVFILAPPNGFRFKSALPFPDLADAPTGLLEPAALLPDGWCCCSGSAGCAAMSGNPLRPPPPCSTVGGPTWGASAALTLLSAGSAGGDASALRGGGLRPSPAATSALETVQAPASAASVGVKPSSGAWLRCLSQTSEASAIAPASAASDATAAATGCARSSGDTGFTAALSSVPPTAGPSAGPPCTAAAAPSACAGVSTAAGGTWG